jgi:CelD/BcsL family acetyltransferase involved in cellulose biosynthesis
MQRPIGTADVIETHDRFDPALIREWEELADRTGASPFHRPGWFAAWRDAFGRGRVETVAVRADGRLTGVAVVSRRLGAVTSASNWHTPMFGFLAEDDRAADELARGVLRRARHSLTVRFLDEEDGLTERALVRAAGGRLRRRVLERSPYIDTRGDWENYEAALGSRRRRELRRRWRRLAELGEATFEVHDGGQDLDRLLEEGLTVEGSGWKDERGTAIRARPETRRFYREVAGWAADRGWLVLGFLRLAGRPIAFDYCVEHAGTHYLLKTGYDPALRHLAPGMLLRQEMIRRAYGNRVRRYDFLGDDNPWKLDWTDRVHERRELRTYPASPLGSLGWLADTYARPAAGRVLRSVRRRGAS